MTDNEIKKALEDIIKHLDFTQTKSGENVLVNALDLISRQQAEIEEHKNNCEKCGAKTRECIESLQNIIAEKQAEIERLQNTLDDVLDRQPILVARAEKYAVEEFADQLNQMAQWLPLTAIPDRFVTVSNINKLVKERTGEE